MIPALFTIPTPLREVKPGDVYLVGTVGGARETRRVLEVFPRALGSAVLYVEDPRGETFRAHVSGRVEVVHHA